MNTYPLTQTNKNQEFTIIKEILKNNGYQHSDTHHKRKSKTQENTHKHKKKNKSRQHLHTLVPKPELLLTYLGTQTSRSLIR
jgi:hypothetical protein